MNNILKVKIRLIPVTDETGKPLEPAQMEAKLETGIVSFPLTILFTRFDSDSVLSFDTGDAADIATRIKYPVAQKLLDKVVDGGLWWDGENLYTKSDRKRTGVHYVPLFAGASNARKGMFMMVDENKKDAIWRFLTGGMDLSKLTVSKIAKYVGLGMSAVRPWTEVFPVDGLGKYIPEPELDDMCVLPDIEVECDGEVDEVLVDGVHADKIVRHLVKHMNKITDGNMFYMINDRGMSKAERRKLQEQLSDWTARNMFVKGMTHPILATTVEFFINKYCNGNDIVKDFWGQPVALLTKKIIAFGSVLKAAKCVYSYDHYVHCAQSEGWRFWVCITDHGEKLNGTSYQQLQTLDMTDDEVDQLAQHCAGQLRDGIENGHYRKIASGWMGKILEKVPAMMKHDMIKSLMQNSWANQRRRMIGGRMPFISHNLFCAIDPVAIFARILGVEDKVQDVIAPRKVHTTVFPFGIQLGCTRSPHLDHAWAIRINQNIPDEFRGFFLGNTIFYSAHDNTMLLHQMDFDGDHSNVTDLQLLIKVALKSFKTYNNRVLLYSACEDIAGAPKGCSDYAKEFAEKCKNAFAAPIGQYANALTKCWAALPYERDRVAYLTRSCNTCIDEAGGHGADVTGNAKYTSAVEGILDGLRKAPKPAHLFYAKGHISEVDNKTVIGADGSIVPNEKEFRWYQDSTVCRYSAASMLLLPETFAELIDVDSLGDFDWHILCCDPARKAYRIKGLVGQSTGYDEDSMKTVYNDGIWNKLCRQTAAEIAEIVSHSSMKAYPSYMEERSAVIRAELQSYATGLGYTLEEIIDALIAALFGTIKSGSSYVSETTGRNFAVRMFQTFFMVFGQEVYNNVLRNLGEETQETEDGTCYADDEFDFDGEEVDSFDD